MPAKTPRNAPCPCGSGRKFKVCCLPGRSPSPRFAFPTPPTPNRLPIAFRSAAPVPRKWNEVIFDAPLANGGRLHAVLLYSDAGLRLSPFRTGELLTLDLPDIHFRGLATILRIQPTQATAEAEAKVLRVVRFRHDDDLGTPLHGEWNPPSEFIERWRSRRRELVLRLDYPDDGWCDIRLLRTVKWIEQHNAHEGATVFLDLAEVGTRGWAKVVEVLPCGPVEIGPGDMVTGTFRHSHGRTGDLVLGSEPEPIGVTPGHLFWSVDRQAWVPVGSLRPGETLQTSKGLTRVVSYTMTDRIEPVYNLEVEGSNCYRVGESGVLVHNTSADCEPGPNQLPDCLSADPETGPNAVGRDFLRAVCPGSVRVTLGPCAATASTTPMTKTCPEALRGGKRYAGTLYECVAMPRVLIPGTTTPISVHVTCCDCCDRKCDKTGECLRPHWGSDRKTGTQGVYPGCRVK